MVSKEQFEGWFHDYYRPLCSLANLYVKDVDVAQDLVQDVFARFWTRIHEVEIAISAKVYLFKSVKNASLDYLYQQKRKASSVDVDDIQDTYADNTIHFEPDVKNNINKAIQSLPDRCRTIFILSRIEGLKHKEIADKLDIAEKTVEVQVRKASIILRKQLSDYATIILGLLLIRILF